VFSIKQMLKFTRPLLLLLLLRIPFNLSFGQNYFVSNLYNNLVFSNPSLASKINYSVIHLNYRNQWPVAGMYSTYGIAYFQNIKGLKSNVGLILNHDSQLKSAFTSTLIGLNYSYKLTTGNRSEIFFGLNGNYVFDNLNYNNLSFENQPSNLSNEKKRFPVINSGISLRLFNQHLIGFSVVNILGQKSNNLLSQEYNLCYIGDLEHRRWGNLPLKIEPVGKITYKKSYFDFSYGCNIGFSPFKTGILITQSNLKINSTTFLLGILYDNFEFIYTYDLNLSGVISANPKMAAHEVTFLSKLQYKLKSKKHRAIKCPKF
jgi:type IX secretion system PorP/SprF family membrane protein